MLDVYKCFRGDGPGGLVVRFSPGMREVMLTFQLDSLFFQIIN